MALIYRHNLRTLLKTNLLVVGATLEHTLNHSTPVRVATQLAHATTEAQDDKVQVVARDLLDALLDDVVAVLIEHQFDDEAVEFANEERLTLRGNRFQSLE